MEYEYINNNLTYVKKIMDNLDVTVIAKIMLRNNK